MNTNSEKKNDEEKQPLLEFIRMDRVHVKDIIRNELNPRQHFPPSEIENLKESIRLVGGVLVPLVVFERGGKYVLLDGERRWKASKELAEENPDFAWVLVNIIKEPTTDLVNLLTMFNIHMNRESWSPAATAVALGKMIEASGIDRTDILSEITGIKTGTINDHKVFLQVPEDLQKRAVQGTLDAWHLIALQKNLIGCQSLYPDVVNSFGFDSAFRNFIEKIDKGWIRNYRDFYALNRVAKSCVKFKTDKLFSQVFRKLMEEIDFTPKDAEVLVNQELEAKFDLSFLKASKNYLKSLNSYTRGRKVVPNETFNVMKKIAIKLQKVLKQLKKASEISS